MALDLGKTALQIERMTDDLRAQQSGKLQRLDHALEVVDGFDTEAYEDQRARSAQTVFLVSCAKSLPSPSCLEILSSARSDFFVL